MTSYQQKQIKNILLVVFVLMAILYCTQLKQTSLPKEVSRTQAELYKYIDKELKHINSREDFKQWAINKKYIGFQPTDTEFKSVIQRKKLEDESCEWVFTLNVNFGIQIKSGPKQYLDKVRIHEIDVTKYCTD